MDFAAPGPRSLVWHDGALMDVDVVAPVMSTRTKALLLEPSRKVIRELNRGYYCADAHRFIRWRPGQRAGGQLDRRGRGVLRTRQDGRRRGRGRTPRM